MTKENLLQMGMTWIENNNNNVVHHCCNDRNIRPVKMQLSRGEFGAANCIPPCKWRKSG